MIPKSGQSLAPAGLFVVFKSDALPATDRIRNPYAVLSEKLFLPFQTTLFPKVAAAELEKMLLWEVQVFHPALGFVGFEKADEIRLADWLHLPPPGTEAWSLAHPGLPHEPRLQHIRIQPPDLTKMFEDFHASVGGQPLQDIPKDKPDAPIGDWLDKIRLGLLKGISGMSNKLSGGEYNPAQYLTQWLTKNIEDLERKRDSEINRLLNLFETNLEEALKFAIPLDTPYLNRGDAPPSDRLSRRDTNFNLGNLGGGGRVDGWNLDNHYFTLRQKYLQAANQEIQNKNFKKAAYIYAHLLGDFQAAANVLQQGRFYREAAVLYKDHLHNPRAAAECLEKGGLLSEAIELYAELSQFEKAGDLSRTLGQEQTALHFFQKSVQQALSKHDCLEAARLQRDKMLQPDQAQATLFRGWEHNHQAETCLLQFFDHLEKDKLPLHLKEVYEQRTPIQKKLTFLKVMEQVFKKNPEKPVQETALSIAYHLISQEVARTNTGVLSALRTFLPDDKLIVPDYNRYLSLHQKPPEVLLSEPVALQGLLPSVQWLTGIAYRKQFLAFGIEKNSLYLARGNWKGYVEYHVLKKYTADAPVSSDQLRVIAESAYTDQVMVLQPGFAETKKLPATSELEDTVQLLGVWHRLPVYTIGISIQPTQVAVLHIQPPNNLVLSYFDMNGSLIKTYSCTEHGKPFMLSGEEPFVPMYFRKSCFYILYDGIFLKITGDGQVTSLLPQNRSNLLAVTDPQIALRCVVSTEQGCVLIKNPHLKTEATPTYFAQEIAEPVAVHFINSAQVVVASKYEAVAYQVGNDMPVVLCRMEFDEPVVAILSVHERNRCAFLTESGQVVIHSLTESA